MLCSSLVRGQMTSWQALGLWLLPVVLEAKNGIHTAMDVEVGSKGPKLCLWAGRQAIYFCCTMLNLGKTGRKYQGSGYQLDWKCGEPPPPRSCLLPRQHTPQERVPSSCMVSCSTRQMQLAASKTSKTATAAAYVATNSGKIFDRAEGEGHRHAEHSAARYGNRVDVVVRDGRRVNAGQG